MEYILEVSDNQLNKLYHTDIDFYYDGDGEVSFDSEDEYNKARKILKEANANGNNTL